MKENVKYKIDGVEFLNGMQDAFSKIVFFDPQYRGIMEKMKYGNEGARQKERAVLPQMNEDNIKEFIFEIFRVLKPSGYLFLWVDKFHLCEGISSWLPHTSGKDGLEIVDMIVWDKGKIGMGYRSRRRSEYLVIIQKLPRLARATWTVHTIPDVWLEKLNGNEKKHPHQKPMNLIKQLIIATTEEGDVVVDPAAGSFVVLDAAVSLGRNAFVTDIAKGVVG